MLQLQLCCVDQMSLSDSEEKQPETSEVLKSNALCSSTSRYLTEDFMGEGSFGKVAEAVNLLTTQIMALNILKT